MPKKTRQPKRKERKTVRLVEIHGDNLDGIRVSGRTHYIDTHPSQAMYAYRKAERIYAKLTYPATTAPIDVASFLRFIADQIEMAANIPKELTRGDLIIDLDGSLDVWQCNPNPPVDALIDTVLTNRERYRIALKSMTKGFGVDFTPGSKPAITRYDGATDWEERYLTMRSRRIRGFPRDLIPVQFPNNEIRMVDTTKLRASEGADLL